MAKLEKARITIKNGSRAGTVYEVLFNPTEYSFDRSNSFKSTPIPGLTSPLLQFINGEADQLSMELFLDDYTDTPGRSAGGAQAKSVEARVKELSDLLNIDASLHAPPSVMFSWGPLEFVGLIEKMGRKVTLFQPDGTAARVRLSVTFKEYRSIDEQLRSPRRESTDKSKRRVIVGDDSVWMVASREYGDPAQWRYVADQNDLDDPREVRPGQWLILPPLESDLGPV